MKNRPVILLCAWLLTAAMGHAQPNRYLPIRLPSYNALSILDHLKTPRGQYTGVPEVSVPITTVQSRKLSLPVTLHYNAGGVRVGTLASWVGLNWSLDAGGVVMRVPYGVTDTYTLTGGVQRVLAAVEPDLFYFQVAGISGKFFLRDLVTGVEFVTMPASNLRIAATWASNLITGFVITDDGGNQYHFARQETTQQELNGVAQAQEVNAWYLTKIVPGTYGDEITLEYTSYSTGYHFVAHGATGVKVGDRFFTTAALGNYAQHPGAQHASSAAACSGCPSVTEAQLDLTTVRMRVVDGARLSRINFVNGRVDFLVHSTNRDDIDDRALQRIEVYSVYDGQTKLISRHELVQSYFSASCPSSTSEKRLRLDRIKQWYEGLWSTPVNPTKSIDTWFTYDDSQCMPKRDSYAQDLWGYWNGATTATTLAPELSTSNRSVGTAAVLRVGSLSAVHTQAGARTKYTYEPHNTPTLTPNEVGGLRVSQVETQPNGVDGATDNIIRQYTYTTDAGSSSGVLQPTAGAPTGLSTGFAQQLYRVVSVTGGCTPPASHRLACGAWVRGTFTRYDVLQESPIEYARVTEHRGPNGINGRTVTRYVTQATSGADDAGSASYRGTPPSFRDWRRGMTTMVRLLDMTNVSNPQRVSEDTTLYTYFTSSTGGFTYRSVSGTSSQSYTVLGQTFNLSGSYTHEGGWFHAHQSQSTSWSQDVPPLAFPPTTTFYTYDNAALLLREQESTGDGTERLGTFTRYVRDLVLPGTGTDDATVAALRNLQTTGRANMPLEVLSFRRASPGAERMVTGAAVSVYRTHLVQEIGGSLRTVALPHRSFGARMSQPQAMSTVFTAPTVTNVGGTNQLNLPSLYGYQLSAPDHRTEGIQLSYDAFGQPLRSRNRIGMPSDVRYGYSSTEVVAGVSNGQFAPLDNPTGAATASHCDAEEAVSATVLPDGWTLYASGAGSGGGQRTNTEAHSGRWALRGPASAAQASTSWNGIVFRQLNAEDQAASYVLSAWVKSTGAGHLALRATLPGSQSAAAACTSGTYFQEEVAIPNTQGKWELFVTRLDLARARTSCFGGGTAHLLAFAAVFNGQQHTMLLDDIRLHKLDATMQTACIDPLVGATATCVGLSNCTYTEYDDLGRVVIVRDRNGFVLKQYAYQIKQ